ncbi:unnamed protein product [Rotaria magnacalcarata]|uniref:Phosphatidate phosphatase APP1 catalytic domain-containing protein n=5 Tax=Rotaria magnacalcarata TaxID=392030 RepID=A0A816CL41_9BILA|nr:unnamed protein product [Rotaria magnacalcarata]CAF1623307.1 unnamed protein product [Rotaria magnacalcarata]CAF2066562.1 unnamed protein product [Rotaria magnacalcarata]CAF2080800.1 unnamed protein product [Rotaria magnacalcarata]CAF2211626.1 unnamed protein product [Rotaria magnacalcarata]
MHIFQDNNPFTTNDSKIKEKFMLIPSIGYELDKKQGNATLAFDGWYYRSLDSSIIKNIIKNTLQAALDFMGKGETANEERLEPFFVADVPDRKFKLRLSESISQVVSTDENGRFHQTIIVNSLIRLPVQGQVLKYIAIDDSHSQNGYEGTVYVMKNTDHIGCSIISDIDDTIKISEVPFKTKLMMNTFKKPFEAVPGMSDVYRSWESLHQCLIHYVSAMPSQLYYVTQNFLNQQKFPGGSFHMRHLKLVSKEKVNLLKHIIDFVQHDASQRHKVSVIENILTHAPIKQQFTMVGDSGEVDPEIYGTIARRFPHRINMIFIRVVDGGKNDDNRFKDAFQNVSRDKWKLFSNAAELPKKLYNDINTTIPIDITIDVTSVKPNNTKILSTSFVLAILPMLVTLVFISQYI